MKSPKPRHVALLLLGFAAIWIAGCGRKLHMLEVDPEFSYNLVRTPSWFPDPRQPLAPAEQEVYDRRGRPDFIRMWWKKDGSLISGKDLAGMQPDNVRMKLLSMKKSWLYLDEDEEVIFMNEGRSLEVQKIGEVTKLVAEYGDPSSRTAPARREAGMYETWMWMDHGLKIEFIDGKEAKRSHFKGSGTGTYLLK